jgi:RNAse (barnase) inhibitor barstar
MFGSADTGAGTVWGVQDVIKLVLNGHEIASQADFQDMIDRAARAEGFTHYGRDLDATWDVLTALLARPVEVHWRNADARGGVLGERFERIVSLLEGFQRLA